jgi:hypothetical protein
VVPEETARIRLAWPDVGAEELDAIAEVVESGMLTMGSRVAEFEAELARACETRHAVAVSSGTAALHLAVLALGLDPGDEVIVPAYTFPATANVVALSGLKPVLVDVDPVTMNLDPAQVVVGPRTRAILAVHLFGRPARLEERSGRGTVAGRAARSVSRAACPSTRARSSRRARVARSRPTTTTSPRRCVSCATMAGMATTCRRRG